MDQEILRKLGYNTNWDGTCGTCGNRIVWHPKYGSDILVMKRTYCGAIYGYSNNLIAKNSKPKWCPRVKEMKKLGLEFDQDTEYKKDDLFEENE